LLSRQQPGGNPLRDQLPHLPVFAMGQHNLSSAIATRVKFSSPPPGASGKFIADLNML
jgi:hypothetical protein